ncbi:MAG: LysR family transcriptional regulator [Bacillota bacterium]|nr:LysR family transcriptional regulator [Bacillota bacterium]
MEKFLSSNYIQTIAEVKSISVAAEKLGISQPALSSYLKKQEERLETVLFDRAKQPIQLTEAGRIYLRYAEKFAALDKEFMQHIVDLEELRKGSLTIGGASFFNVSYLPKAVAKFSEAYPGIDMEIVDGRIPDISMKALNGQLDLFITPTREDDDRFHYEELLQERIFLCVPSDWSINETLKEEAIPVESILQPQASGGSGTKSPCVDFAKFRQLPFVLLQEDQHIGQVMEALFHKYGFEPQHRVSVEQTMTSYALTLAGVGISLITESSIRNSNFREFPALYMVDREICRRKMFVAYPKQKYLSRASKEFIKILKINI